MPMLDLPQRLRELGRIRAGEQVQTRSGKRAPSALATWRLTSPSHDLLEPAAQLYGGTVSEWAEAPTKGEQWQLTTATDQLDVIVPMMDGYDPLSQWWELWSGGGCQRRCDGQHETISDQPCLCPADFGERLEKGRPKQGKPTACLPYTRLSVLLPRLPDLGVWRVEAHGANAAVEMPAAVSTLRTLAARGTMIDARLRLEQRTKVDQGKTHQFVVPVLELPGLTVAALMTGEIPHELASATPALGAGDDPAPEAERHGRPSDEQRPAVPPSRPAADSSPMLRAVWRQAERAGLSTDQVASIIEEVTGMPPPCTGWGDDPAKVNAVLDALRQMPDDPGRPFEGEG